MKSHYSYELRKHNLKATPIRINLMKIFDTAHHPVDILWIRLQLEKAKISADEATVYRNVNEFVQKGLLRKVLLKEGKTHFEITSLPHHHHAICTDCGKIEEINVCTLPALEEEIKRNSGFKVNNHSLEFFGQCSACR